MKRAKFSVGESLHSVTDVALPNSFEVYLGLSNTKNSHKKVGGLSLVVGIMYLNYNDSATIICKYDR